MIIRKSLFPGLHSSGGLLFSLRTVHVLLVIGLWFVATTSYAQKSESEKKSWLERTTVSGDFRSRYEGFYKGEQTPRHRGRMRLRLRFDTEINDETNFQLRIAGGDPGTPVSTNQSFTNFFLPKPVHLDRAFLTYTPKSVEALTLGVGKFGYPVSRTQMVWDDDLNWEGTYQQVAWDVNSRVGVKLAAVQTTINEVKAEKNATMMAGYGQVNIDLDSYSVVFSVADYSFGQVDQVAVATATGPLRTINTNRLYRNHFGAVTGFMSEFNLVDVIGEVIFETERTKYPVRFLADWVTNTRAAAGENMGLWLEAAYGQAVRPKTYAAGYTFGHVEQEAVLSPFMYSDIPGTNLTLHMLDASYMLIPNVNVDLTLFFSKPLVVPVGVSTPWLMRMQFDVRAGF